MTKESVKEDITIKEEAVEEVVKQSKEVKRKGVYIKLAGEEYKVRFPVSALIKLQNETGVRIKDLEDEEKAQDLEVIIALIWAGLITESPDITRDFVADNIELHELNGISEKVVSVISAPGK